MAHVATLPVPDVDELDAALKLQKNAAKSSVRRDFLEKRDSLLQRIPPLPEYQPMAIEYRAAVSHLPEGLFPTPRALLSLIWT